VSEREEPVFEGAGGLGGCPVWGAKVMASLVGAGWHLGCGDGFDPGARGLFPVSVSGGGGVSERAEDSEALDVGDGRCKQGLQPGFSAAPVAGFAHPEVLEVVDLAFHFRAVP